MDIWEILTPVLIFAGLGLFFGVVLAIASKVFFYAMYIIATTLMPQFVHDKQARILWFGIILFVAYGVYALRFSRSRFRRRL